MKINHRATFIALVSVLGFAGQTSRASDWPQWLGLARDGHAAPSEAALKAISSDLKPVWRITVGGGFSSPVLAAGKLVYMDEDGANEVVHLIDTATAREQWKTVIDVRFTDEWGAGPRSTPVLDGDRIYVLSCRGEFRCLKFATGEVIWKTSFEKDFGVAFVGSKASEGTASRRGNNGSSLIDGPNIIVPVGSAQGASLVAFDKVTGRIVWKALNDEAAYSSPKLATLAGVQQVVAFTADALVGLEHKTGALLWRVPLKTNAKRHAATPIIWDNFVVVQSHTLGQICYRIVTTEAGMKAEKVWANPETKINVASHIKVGGFLFGQGPSKDFVCVDAATGKVQWTQPGFGKEVTSTLAVGSTLLALTDDGQLIEMPADGAACREIARVQVCGKNWNFPAFVDGKLFVRDQRELLSFDFTGGGKP